MEKILLGLTVLFFTIAGSFYFFLTRFNEINKNPFNPNRVAGVAIEKKASDKPSPEPTFFPTKVQSPATSEPTPQISKISIPLGKIQIYNNYAVITATKEYPENAAPTESANTGLPLIKFADFSLEIKFPGKILPGSSNNKFISQNKEYEVKLFSQIGTEEGFNRQNFFAEKTGPEIQMLLYKINGNSVIINRETGWWEGGVQLVVGVTDSGEVNDKNVVRFFIE